MITALPKEARGVARPASGPGVPARRRRALRVLVGVLLAAALLATLVPRRIGDPERDFQRAVAGALATEADDPLLRVALDQYPEQAPAIAITYGRLDLFREQLARFGPQVVPIVAAYQHTLTTADALQALQSAGQRLAGSDPAQQLAPLTPEERGLLALLKMRDEGNAFVGQWEITGPGEARRVPSRMVTLGGPELLLGGLTALERDLVRRQADRLADLWARGRRPRRDRRGRSPAALCQRRRARRARRPGRRRDLRGRRGRVAGRGWRRDAPVGGAGCSRGARDQRRALRPPGRPGRADGAAPGRVHALCMDAGRGRGDAGHPRPDHRLEHP